MPETAAARVTLLWHLHQPDYRLPGEAGLPWVYFRALREYSDMAAHLEAVPDARVVVNFTPVLLDQLLDLAAQATDPAEHAATALPRPYAALLGRLPPEQRGTLLQDCLRVHPRNAHERYPAYATHAADAARAVQAGTAAVLAYPAQALDDLVMWTHLAWLPESLRAGDPDLQPLLTRSGAFTAEQRQLLLRRVSALLRELLPRYRALAQSGRVELSVSPYYHPLLPLLIDFASARDSDPGAVLPQENYPGGTERARWHVEQGLRRFTEVFGQRPRGCWPAEGAVSEASLDLLQQAGVEWIATSPAVRRSDQRQLLEPACCLRRAGGLACFFRDDELSDRIGFVYKHWEASLAVRDLVQHLEVRSRLVPMARVLLALDGENPWEHYPGNGLDFVRGLYRALAQHSWLRLSTLSDCLDALRPALPVSQVRLSGSWAGGSLHTWIGGPDKNRLWEELIALKRAFDAHPAPSPAAVAALGACEGSDWFWWPGEHRPPQAVSDFEHLFQCRLRAAYAALGVRSDR